MEMTDIKTIPKQTFALNPTLSIGLGYFATLGIKSVLYVSVAKTISQMRHHDFITDVNAIRPKTDVCAHLYLI